MEPFFLIVGKGMMWKQKFDTESQAQVELIRATKEHGSNPGWVIETHWRKKRELSADKRFSEI